ncbi:MAG TPA: DUF1697 domain-containing protein [Solirubrobacterales bacterium]
MARVAAFLRGINIADRRVKNDDLRAAVEAVGFEEVAIFRASGNVVLEAGGASPAEVTRRLEEGLERELGFGEVRSFVRSGPQLRAIAGHEPFTPEQVAASKGKLQVALLAKAPPKVTRAEVLALATDDDLLAFEGRELYWLPRGGTQESTLGQERLAKTFGTATMRTQGTIQQIAAKYFA